jgi:predicted lipoprotein with Yx(FWY)xxD motif
LEGIQEEMHMIRRRTRTFASLALAALVGLALVAGGCGDDDDDDASPTAAATTAAAASPTSGAPASPTSAATTATGSPTAAAGDTTILVAQHPTLGAILTDSAGLTLYTFTNDTAGSGTSACTEGCANAWPPLTTTADPTAPAAATGELATIARPDGAMQVTYKGLPLYRFASDAAPGDANGQGVGNVWFVAEP